VTARPYRQGARARSVEATRKRIAEAFFDCWRERWFDEITLEEVAQRAGVSVRTLMRQFDSKEGLVAGSIGYMAPEITEARTVAPGDVDAAIERLFENYEQDGDATIRTLAQEGRLAALAPLLANGRAGHRAVTAANFAPWLDALPERQRLQALDALVIATDVYIWKLLRRDMRRTEARSKAAMRSMVEALLSQVSPPGWDGISAPPQTRS
jgi:AcrR family transcriptional regulator